MRVNNHFNISRLLETELILKTLVLLGPGQLKSSAIFQIILFYFHLFYLFNFRGSSKCYIYWIIPGYPIKSNIISNCYEQ